MAHDLAAKVVNLSSSLVSVAIINVLTGTLGQHNNFERSHHSLIAVFAIEGFSDLQLWLSQRRRRLYRGLNSLGKIGIVHLKSLKKKLNFDTQLFNNLNLL